MAWRIEIDTVSGDAYLHTRAGWEGDFRDAHPAASTASIESEDYGSAVVALDAEGAVIGVEIQGYQANAAAQAYVAMQASARGLELEVVEV